MQDHQTKAGHGGSLIISHLPSPPPLPLPPTHHFSLLSACQSCQPCPTLHARKIEAAREAAEGAGVALFINARTDVYLKGLAEGEAAYEAVVARAALYREAGASGVFVPGAAEPDLVGRLAKAIALPLNIMLWGGTPKAAELKALGVRRLSSGGSPFRAAYASLARSVAAYLADGGGEAFAATEGLGNLNARFGS